METPREARLDARAMKVLAHPLRTRLLGALRLEGPDTATGLARLLGTNSGATSYHLRRLADVGLVEETGTGTGRQRVWRAAHDRHSWTTSAAGDDPDAVAANDWLQQDATRLAQERVSAWHAEKQSWPLPWRDVAGLSDYFLDLTPDRLAALLHDLDAVVERYRGETPGEGSHRVFLYLHACPDVLGRPAEPDGGAPARPGGSDGDGGGGAS
ncbi:ArsR family transcriptional regulator [Georgenia soli]|uniref:ArsR family transcriptional regulator n=1 Tax=Georgenia soli TaxID=638953 RepID=A0A2A9EJN0_9MICO|nr:helix-turn-helix domain-containing protein [Georgenia soli]PFG38450.1 ArsR family transcriptional regulator [Georgenia soli]